MAALHDDYIGPAGINRAFTLIADSRDGLREQRKQQVLESCYTCRTEFNCTDVCPKEISPTRAIKYIQRQAIIEVFQKKISKSASLEAEVETIALPGQAAGNALANAVQDDSRRRFLKRMTYTLGAATAVLIGGVLASTAVAPALRKSSRVWAYAGKTSDFDLNTVTTVNLRFQAKDGFYLSRKTFPVMVTRKPGADDIVVYNSRCTHLGCTVHWDDEKRLFLCACHGGAFNPDGSVKTGPPPKPLMRCNHKIKNGALFVEVV
jgi:succinate dehydrogenase / fumarate reductase iron-sulfur subunit